MKPSALALLLLCPALAGCTTWVHPTKTEADFERDAYECERDAAAVQDPIRLSLMRDRCMRVKGWRPQ